MEKFGWQKGKGLGANENGRVENVKASAKNDTKGKMNLLLCSINDFDCILLQKE